MQPTCIVCGSQALEPNLWATATLTASSDSLSPTYYYYYYYYLYFKAHQHEAAGRLDLYYYCVRLL